MTIKQSSASHSIPLNDHQESSPMNLDSLSRLATETREADVRHHIEKRALELAATRRSGRTAAAGTRGFGFVSRLVGWLAPRRVATASGTATRPATPQPAMPLSQAGCSPTFDCGSTTAHRSVS